MISLLTGNSVRKLSMRTVSMLFLTASAILGSNSVFAACDCGSTSASSPCTGNSISVTVAKTVTFKWGFKSGSSDATCGQFANGDYWIAPASGQSSVTITSISSSGSGPVALDADPKLESLGLLPDGDKTYGNYSADENLMGKLPVSYSKPTSLVAAAKRNEAAFGDCGTKAIVGDCIDAYDVVTVLSAIPANNGATILRPNISSTTKDLLSIDTDFVSSRLPSKSYLDGGDSAYFEEVRERWAHSIEVFSMNTISGAYYSEGGRAFRAAQLVPDYAGGTAVSWHGDLMALFANQTMSKEKKRALASMLTYGKDIYFSVYDGNTRIRNWGSGAGQFLGRFPAAVFFAAMAQDSSYANNLKTTSTTLLGYKDIRGPHELEQVNIGKNGPIWGDSGDDPLDEMLIDRYWDSALVSNCFAGATSSCNPGLGKKTERDPYEYIDGPANLPGTNYMSVSIGPQRALVAEMLLIPKMCEIVNYDPLVQYVDRVNNSGIKALPDPCAPPDTREDQSTCDPYRSSNCKYYGKSNGGVATWGPDPRDATQCIHSSTTCTLSGGSWTCAAAQPGDHNYGQNGRFPDQNGVMLSTGYQVAQVEANWDVIRGSSETCGSGSTTVETAAPNPPSQILITQ